MNLKNTSILAGFKDLLRVFNEQFQSAVGNAKKSIRKNYFSKFMAKRIKKNKFRKILLELSKQ